MVRDALQELISGVLETDISFSLEQPRDPRHGDYATNVALLLAQKEKKDPKAMAEEVVSLLLEKKPEYVEKIDTAGPGFINFHLRPEFFTKNTEQVTKDGKGYGRNDALSGKRIIIEYTDPNPFKEIHIGHIMSNAIGESIARILEAHGAEVKRANYQGDVGLHVAQAIWGLKQGKSDLGHAYAYGAQKYGDDEDAQTEIIAINQKIYDETDPDLNALYKNGKEESLERFESMYARLGTQFDFYFFESETGKRGKKMVLEHLEKGVFEKSEGAIIFRGEEKGLHTRVFLTSLGLPTYEAKELALPALKEENFSHDMSLVVTGNEVKEYFHVAMAALAEIDPVLSKKQVHIPHGMLRLSSGKMSSRTGDVITGEEILSDITKKLKERLIKEKSDVTDDMLDAVAVSALKYTVLKHETKKDIVFDSEKSVSFTGDSGPYLQYTYARCLSLLKKGKENGIGPSAQNGVTETKYIERVLLHFPEVVERAGLVYEPHFITTYLHDLASTFNTYYGKTQIVDTKDPMSCHKLLVTQAVSVVIKNGLSLLGITAPAKM